MIGSSIKYDLNVLKGFKGKKNIDLGVKLISQKHQIVLGSFTVIV